MTHFLVHSLEYSIAIVRSAASRSFLSRDLGLAPLLTRQRAYSMHELELPLSTACSPIKAAHHRICFASDNWAPAHPSILEHMYRCSQQQAAPDHAYGADSDSTAATALLKSHFGAKAQVIWTLTTTASNALCVQLACRSYHSVLTPTSSHMLSDECGVIERLSGCRLIDPGALCPASAPSHSRSVDQSKLNLTAVKDWYASAVAPRLPGSHTAATFTPLPKLISITQPTEQGTLYTLAELKEIVDWAHAHQMYVHMDGARLPLAAAAMRLSFAALTTELGIDLVSFGLTKAGGMLSEAVIILAPELMAHANYLQRQSLQLISKNRYIAQQFQCMLQEDRWKAWTLHSIQMAQRLYQGLAAIPGIRFLHEPVEANSVFLYLPPHVIKELSKKYDFYVWDEATHLVRWMTSYATLESDVDALLKDTRASLAMALS
jgi:threonine aldolase